MLDVCCGTGEVARHVAQICNGITGFDFSESMMDQSRIKLLNATFVEGDAQDLPFEDRTFDTVLTNFGHYQLGDADRAIKEAARVLKPGGTYCFTTWCGPDTFSGFKMIFDMVMGNINPGIDLPSAPDAFRLFDSQTAYAVMVENEFENVSIETYLSTINCRL